MKNLCKSGQFSANKDNHFLIILFIFSSNRLVDEQISIAIETRDHLSNQRIIFKRFQTRINDLSNRFPLLNGLIQKIHVRKRRDSLILGVVVGICTILLLAYVFW